MRILRKRLKLCLEEVLRGSFDLEDIKLFDSHAHYFDERFENPHEILSRDVFNNGVVRVINVGTNNENNIICINQASKYDGMYAAVGIHPEDSAYCKSTPEEEISVLERIIGDAEQRRAKKIVALGEIGFDFHWGEPDKQKQARYFELQMQLAEKLSLPVIIHDRDAHGACFDMVLKYPRVRGVFHSYSGSAEMARELVRRGWYISFSGVITFKNAERVREVAASVPLDRLLIETDAPYLAPHPYRGKLNHSGLMRYTAETLARVKEVSVEDIIKITYDNAMTLFFA